MLQKRFYLNSAITWRKMGRGLGSLEQSNAVSDVGGVMYGYMHLIS
jgi:hypothetical protein